MKKYSYIENNPVNEDRKRKITNTCSTYIQCTFIHTNAFNSFSTKLHYNFPILFHRKAAKVTRGIRASEIHLPNRLLSLFIISSIEIQPEKRKINIVQEHILVLFLLTSSVRHVTSTCYISTTGCHGSADYPAWINEPDHSTVTYNFYFQKSIRSLT